MLEITVGVLVGSVMLVLITSLINVLEREVKNSKDKRNNKRD